MKSIGLTLYSIVMWATQPFLRCKIARRGVAEPGYLINIEERFGLYAQAADSKENANQRIVWIHAVSLGETRAAGVLIQSLRKLLPGMKLLLTHGTATGREEGQKLLRDIDDEGDIQVWQAWDTVAATERFIQHFKPRIGIMMETELWPNMAATCAKFKVPLVIANARMSEKTLSKTLMFSWLARPAYRSLAAVWPQTTDDALRFEKLGAPVKGIFGNVKFDAQVDTGQLAQGRSWKTQTPRRIAMFASSREGEELQLLQYLQKNLHQTSSDQAEAQWLIVPRHPQRFREVETLIKQHGFNVSKRSEWLEPASPFNSPNDQNTVLLGNSMGEMALYYGMSDIALLGGTFENLGGQNLIEAAACGCPVVMGPSTFNFAQAAHQAIAFQAAFSCTDLPQAVKTLLTLADDDVALKNAQSASLKFSASSQGAADKTAAAVYQLLY